VLDRPSPIHLYEPGSWGPPEADALIAPHKWHVGEDDDPPDSDSAVGQDLSH
jgi:glucose-6-phosphate 1-dehydrogenase